MARYAVAHANLFDNDITIEVVEANSIREAIMGHSQIGAGTALPEALQDIKDCMFDMDILVSAVLISL